MRLKRLSIVAIVVFIAPVAVGCGGDDNGDAGQAAIASATATPTTTAQPAASHALTIRMTEYAFDPDDARIDEAAGARLCAARHARVDARSSSSLNAVSAPWARS
jgi:hypothetical protein